MMLNMAVCTSIGFIIFFVILVEGIKVSHTSTSPWLVYNICKDDISGCSTPG